MAHLYAAGIVGLDTVVTQNGPSTHVKTDVMNSPVLIKAENYHEAVGICLALLQRLRAIHTRYGRWEMYVNDVPDSPVDDPKVATLELRKETL